MQVRRRQQLGCSLALHAPSGASRRCDELSKMRQVALNLGNVTNDLVSKIQWGDRQPRGT